VLPKPKRKAIHAEEKSDNTKENTADIQKDNVTTEEQVLGNGGILV
jgi:hypothetical protein